MLSAGGLIFVALAISREWEEAREALADAAPAWLVAGWILAAVGMVLVAVTWWDALALLGSRPSRGRVVSMYFRGEIAKYVPGAPWAVLGRGELARRAGISRATSYGSVLLSMGAQYLAAALAAVAMLPFRHSPGLSGDVWWLLFLPVGLACLHPRILGAGRSAVERLLRRPLEVEIPPWSASVVLILRYVPFWACVGGATWCVANALVPEAGFLSITYAAVLSWLVGFLILPAPSGLGVREATFLAVADLPLGVAAAVAVGSRLLFMTVDAAGAVVASLMRGPPASTVSGKRDLPRRGVC